MQPALCGGHDKDFKNFKKFSKGAKSIYYSMNFDRVTDEYEYRSDCFIYDEMEGRWEKFNGTEKKRCTRNDVYTVCSIYHPIIYLFIYHFSRSGNQVVFHNNVAYAASTSLANGKWIVAGGFTSKVAVIGIKNKDGQIRAWSYKNGKKRLSKAVFIPGSGTVDEGDIDLPFRELPIATSNFCLVRLDQGNSKFMTGG